MFSASASSGISAGDITNWDAAFGYGDHSVAGYLTSFTETDPVFSASASSGISAGDISNWNTAHGYGDHSAAGYAVESSSATFTEVVLGDWTIKLSGTDLRFNYNGTDVFKIQSTGAIAGTGDVTANATL